MPEFKKAIIEEGTTTLASDLFNGAENLETVFLPSTLTELGYRAFANCTVLTNVQLPDSITEIGNQTFQNCIGITEIKLPSSLKKIGYGAFSNTSIREIMIPKNLAETNGTMGGPFENCPYLKKVTVEEGVTTIGWRLFYHIESLESVILPSTVTKVEAEAFGGCPNLKNLQLPDSLTTIANNAFDNSPNIKLYCNYGTLTHFYFIEQRKPINLTSHAYTDFSKLAIENDSYYEVDYNGLSSNGCVNVKLYYHTKEEQFKSATDRYICIVVPENTEIFEGTLSVDGVLCTEQFMEGIRCKIPVQKSSGTITFSFKPQASRELFNCAYYEYRTENEIKKEMLGYENSVCDFLTVSAKSITSDPEIVASGIGPKESEIELYINEVLQKSVITSKTGKYQTALELPNPVNGMYYLIEARCADDSEQKASAAVRYNEGQPEVAEFKLYYNNHQNAIMDLLNSASSPYISFNPAVPFTFTAKFDNGDKLENVYVVSTRNNERKVMEATYDDKTERYVASGYFDDNNHNYVPGKITLEYNCGTEVSKVGEEIDWEAKYDLLSDDMKKAAVTSTGNEKDMSYSFDLSEVSEGLKDVGLDLTVSSFDEATDGNLGQWLGISEEYFNLASYVVSGINGEKYLVTTDFSDPKTYFMWIKDITGAANNFTKLKVSMQSAGEWTNLNELTSHLNVVAKGAGAAYDIYNFGVERNELVNEIMQSPNIQNKGTAIRKANELYDNQIMYTLLAAALPLVITTIGISGPVGIGFSALMGVIGVSSSFFWAARVANIKGEAIQIRWGIDPSGYVYEAVKENHLKDVKATVYYKANLEDEESVLWDASEYEQENPLYTGADGGYAWDVPEGYWKVVFEKEGYEPTETDWLCVPPPQTNINVCMISKEKPVIESLDIYPDYAKLVFSKYMKPDSVGTLKLSDENGKDIRYSIEYDRNAVDSEGVNYAKEYILKYQSDKILESGSSCKLISDRTTKSYADIAMESSEISAQVKKNIQFIMPEEVTVKMGDSLDIPVYIANCAENIKFTAASDFEDIVVVEKTDTDYVHVSGKLLGTANVTLSILGTDIKKIIKVNVGESSEKVEVKTTVVWPQSVYVAFIDEDIEIMPEIYPDSTLNGKWETEGAEDIVSIKGNIFHAEKRGMVTARYRLDNDQEIYAECKIVVKAETEPGDINEDGNIDLFDLMLCLNHVAKRSVLEGNAFEAADVDESERVDLFDLMRILNYVAKKTDTV